MTDFKKIFHLMESIDPTYRNHLLNEISIIDKYNKEKEKNNYINKGIDFNTFEELCNIDPTTKPNKVGQYCNWLIAKYNPNTNLEKLKYCLNLFNEKRNILSRYNIPSDINSFKTYEELIETINNLNDNNDDLDISSSEYNNRKKLEGQFELLGSTSFYDIIAPKTFAAERYFGGNTEWCTVARKSKFSEYMEEGQLYILYPKNGDGEYKMQFHFERREFADKYNNVCEYALKRIENVVKDENIRNELIVLCKKVFTENIDYFLPFEEVVESILTKLENGVNPIKIFKDGIGSFKEGFAIVNLMGKYNYINTENKILRSDLWFDNTYDFNEGYAAVYINDKGWTFINADGNFLRDDLWFDSVGDFKDGFAQVYIEDRGWNFIKTDGKILREDIWFDGAGYFNEGYAKVYIDAQGCNWINTKGKFLFSVWFDDIESSVNGIIKVRRKDKKWNLITIKNKPISRIWFDYIYHFEEGFAQVYMKDKGWNYINTDGKILRDDLWFDKEKNFSNGYAEVYMEDKGWNLINTKGKILQPNMWFDVILDYSSDIFAFKKGMLYRISTNGIVYDREGNRVDIPVQESKKYKINWLI